MTKYISRTMRCEECEEEIQGEGVLIETSGGDMVGIFCDEKCWKIYRLRLNMFEQIAKIGRISNQEGAPEELKAWISETHRLACTR
jgi:hypothetical protein